MIPAEDIRDWAGLAVIDPSGGKIGNLEAVYYDTATEEPSFVTVKTGMLTGSRLVMVPLAGAVVGPKHVKVAFSKKLAKDAPSFEVDGSLEASMEPDVFAHYGLDYSRGSGGERRLGRR